MLVLRVALLAVRPGLQEQDCEALDWGLIILRNSGKAARLFSHGASDSINHSVWRGKGREVSSIRTPSLNGKPALRGRKGTGQEGEGIV